jgi:hypothetical protein
LFPDSLDCAIIELSQITFDVKLDEKEAPPKEIQSILQQYQSVFDRQTELPPRRLCDHTITLILGAQPVQSRPHRYAPVLKDEIEKQVQDMLQARIIQPSSSAFSSRVLLVKKKDGT